MGAKEGRKVSRHKIDIFKASLLMVKNFQKENPAVICALWNASFQIKSYSWCIFPLWKQELGLKCKIWQIFRIFDIERIISWNAIFKQNKHKFRPWFCNHAVVSIKIFQFICCLFIFMDIYVNWITNCVQIM